MAKKDELLSLFAKYEAELSAARAKQGYFERLFRSDADLATGRLTQQLIEQADVLLADTPAEEASEIFETILQTAVDHIEDRYLGLTYIALQRNLLPLIPCLTAAQAAAFLAKIESGIPRRSRPPLTEQLLKELKQAAKTK